MAKKSEKRTTALSISLPEELARAVSRRVEGGLYATASEVIREALRLLLETEARHAHWQQNPVGRRLATTFELAELGAAMRATRLSREGDPAADSTTVKGNVEDEDNQLAPGLRLAPKRLKKLKRAASSTPRK